MATSPRPNVSRRAFATFILAIILLVTLPIRADARQGTAQFGLANQPMVHAAGGDGQDGALTLTAPFNCQKSIRTGRTTPDCVATAIRASATAGQTTIAVLSTAGLAARG